MASIDIGHHSVAIPGWLATLLMLVRVVWPLFTLQLYSVLAWTTMILNTKLPAAALDILEWAGVPTSNSRLNTCGILAVHAFGTWIGFFITTVTIATLVDFMAEVVFAHIPTFNSKKRQAYSAKDRFHHHTKFLKNSFLVIALGGLNNVGAVSQSPVVYRQWASTLPSVGSIPAPGTGNLAFDYIVAAVTVQIALLLSDLFYGTFHYFQHKYKFLLKHTGHGYHHNFQYPIAAAGPWLSPGDMVLSGLLTFILPAHVAVEAMHALGFWENRVFATFLMHGFIHEMNHSDHCGKQLPTWSGCPLCPPFGFACCLHQSIPLHEAHHNFSNCGYGLLGIADRVFGTARFPDDHPNGHEKRQ